MPAAVNLGDNGCISEWLEPNLPWQHVACHGGTVTSLHEGHSLIPSYSRPFCVQLACSLWVQWFPVAIQKHTQVVIANKNRLLMAIPVLKKVKLNVYTVYF